MLSESSRCATIRTTTHIVSVMMNTGPHPPAVTALGPTGRNLFIRRRYYVSLVLSLLSLWFVVPCRQIKTCHTTLLDFLCSVEKVY